MEISSLGRDDWNQFCEKSNGWFWHTPDWLAYSLLYLGNPQVAHFTITENKQILAVCPLFLKDNEFVMFWSPAMATLDQKKTDKVLQVAFDHIDELAKQSRVVRSSMMIYPLSFPSHNYLMKYGYLDISINTQVIDLRQSLDDIHGAMRKGHDYDIDRGLKVLECWALDKDRIEPNTFEEYHKLHTKDAGRETRAQSTWDMQYQWIKDGNAVLFGALYKEELVGFSYVFAYKKKTYYGSACSDPNHSELPVGHFLNWKTIEWLKEYGFEYYEIGWQQYGNQFYDFPSPKEVSISKFKRGFGGWTIPLYMGEKYYNKEFFLKTQIDRMKNYVGTLER